MKIEAVDFFYLSMPVVTDAGDGSQDALLVRVAAGGEVGWGECEASPLTSIAAFVCPMSHGACKPVRDVVLGKALSDPDDIAALAAAVEMECMDLLQAAHTFSGIEMALWDLLGRKHGVPVYQLLGYARAYLQAAREGLGPDGKLLIDAGQIFRENVDAAAARIALLEEVDAGWFEEPFLGGAYAAYGALSQRRGKVKVAGGEASHNFHMAQHLIDYGKVSFIQIDCGRIGGLAPAKRVADYAVAHGVTYVNHTFTSHLALCALLQPYAGLKDHVICEYPFAPKPVAWDMSETHLEPDANGEVRVPDAPGLGIAMSKSGIRKYLVDVEIRAKGMLLYRTPDPLA